MSVYLLSIFLTLDIGFFLNCIALTSTISNNVRDQKDYFFSLELLDFSIRMFVLSCGLAPLMLDVLCAL